MPLACTGLDIDRSTDPGNRALTAECATARAAKPAPATNRIKGKLHAAGAPMKCMPGIDVS